MPSKLFRYIPVAYAMDYLMLGWLIHPTNLGHHRYEMTLLGEWLCNCKPVEPKRMQYERSVREAARG